MSFIFNQLSEMKHYIKDNAWDELEKTYFHLCKELSGEDIALHIHNLSIEAYEKQLEFYSKKALELGDKHKAKAIYYEYNLDNDWNSYFFICPSYNSEEEEDEDWACDFIIDDCEVDELSWTPTLDFGDIYATLSGFGRNDEESAIILLLVARTVSCFGRVIQRLSTYNINVCIAFHDQDPIIRVVEI